MDASNKDWEIVVLEQLLENYCENYCESYGKEDKEEHCKICAERKVFTVVTEKLEVFDILLERHKMLVPKTEDDKEHCPTCGKLLNGTKFCGECGQAIDREVNDVE